MANTPKTRTLGITQDDKGNPCCILTPAIIKKIRDVANICLQLKLVEDDRRHEDAANAATSLLDIIIATKQDGMPFVKPESPSDLDKE